MQPPRQDSGDISSYKSYGNDSITLLSSHNVIKMDNPNEGGMIDPRSTLTAGRHVCDVVHIDYRHEDPAGVVIDWNRDTSDRVGLVSGGLTSKER